LWLSRLHGKVFLCLAMARQDSRDFTLDDHDEVWQKLGSTSEQVWGLPTWMTSAWIAMVL
jgi:hypothetical protein